MGCGANERMILAPSPVYTDEQLDAIKGCVIGAFCGDAAGATLEFAKEWTDKTVSEALKMKGGGVLKVGKGQITDDSEMSMSLAHALSVCVQRLDLKKIAEKYREWYDSKPFDMGHTTFVAVSAINPNNIDIEAVKKKVAQTYPKSESNGSLMRITPLAIWAHRLEDEELEKAVREEVTLTHFNETAQRASVCYCLCIKYLLKNIGNCQIAITKMKEYATKKNYNEILEWTKIAEQNKGTKVTDCQDNIGWIKHGFTWGLHFLFNKCQYEEALSIMLEQKGDTDTNACIVGGLIGASVGYKKIPDNLKQTMLKYKGEVDDLGGIPRPDWLYPGNHILDLIDKIVKNAPSRLIIEQV